MGSDGRLCGYVYLSVRHECVSIVSGCDAYLREASALSVLRIRAMRRPLTVERAAGTDLALFFLSTSTANERGPVARFQNEKTFVTFAGYTV